MNLAGAPRISTQCHATELGQLRLALHEECEAAGGSTMAPSAWWLGGPVARVFGFKAASQFIKMVKPEPP